MKSPLERETKERRREREEVAREGKGRGTASFGKDHKEDESDVDDHVDEGCEEEDDEEVVVDDCDGDDEGYEKMMWERDGVGFKSIPMSLAMEANLYVSETSSLFGRNRSNGVLDFAIFSLFLLRRRLRLVRLVSLL